MNSRYRERKYNTSDNDRLLRALSQPVQAWDKKWTQSANSKTLQQYKWVRSDRVIEFEEDESEEEVETAEQTRRILMEQKQADQSTINNTNIVDTTNTANNIVISEGSTSMEIEDTKNSMDSIPGGPSAFTQSFTNKIISNVQQGDEDERRSETPKLDDISDDERESNIDDNGDNDVDSINDPAKHPALAPHAHAHLTDDDMLTDSAAVTPMTEASTPLPLLDEPMEDIVHVSHPLSREIGEQSIMTSTLTEEITEESTHVNHTQSSL
ncbi:hypothetical protein BDB01DRAFT_895656 [Pilobolus umbonatus]|nr:hypothetical protein BDB01DRAFT_895656 [Pilobolus umbonatus]